MISQVTGVGTGTGEVKGLTQHPSARSSFLYSHFPHSSPCGLLFSPHSHSLPGDAERPPPHSVPSPRNEAGSLSPVLPLFSFLWAFLSPGCSIRGWSHPSLLLLPDPCIQLPSTFNATFVPCPFLLTWVTEVLVPHLWLPFQPLLIHLHVIQWDLPKGTYGNDLPGASE